MKMYAVNFCWLKELVKKLKKSIVPTKYFIKIKIPKVINHEEYFETESYVSPSETIFRS